MGDANQDKFTLVQSRMVTGFPASDASHKVCHLHSQFQNEFDRRLSFWYHLTVMGIWKLRPIYTNPGHNNETQGIGTPTSWIVTGILFLSEVPTNNHNL